MLRSRAYGGIALAVCSVLLGLAAAYSPALAGTALLAVMAAVAIGLGPGISAPMAVTACVAMAVLGEQLLVIARTGGAGVLPLAGVVTIFAAALLAGRGGSSFAVDVLKSTALPASLWLGLGAALPLVGIFVGFPLRTIGSVLVPLGAFGALSVGILASRMVPDLPHQMRRALVPSLWFAAAIGAVQLLHYLGTSLMGSASLVSFLEARAVAAGRVVIYGRASGLYANPNTLAALGGIGLVLAFARGTHSRSQRIALAVPSLVLLGVAQSRASIIAAVVGVTVQLLLDSGPARTGRRRAARVLVPMVAAAGLVWIAALEWAPAVVAALAVRVNSLLGGGVGGVLADTSVSGRLAFWSSALAQAVTRPFGTIGPVQVVIPGGVDNEYLYMLLQGGALYLALELWTYVRAWGTALRRQSSMPVGLVVFVALVGMSQLTTGSAPFLIFWLLLGGAFGEARMRVTEPTAPIVERTAS